MASVFTNDLRLEEIGTGEQTGTWGNTTNKNLELIAEAFSYSSTGEAIPNASTHTITVADGTSDEARSLYLKCTGGGQACTVTLAPNSLSKVWIIENQTSFTLTFSQGTGANVAVLAGQVKMIATDGGEADAIVYDLFQDLAVPDLFIDDDLKLQSDGAVLSFGADGDVSLTHVADTALLLNSSRQLQFGDSASFIQQSSDGVLRIDGEATIDLNASTAVTVSNDLKLDSDSAVLGFGSDNDVTLTHVADTALLLNAGMAVQFRDSAISIRSSADATLDLVTDGDMNLTAGVDINIPANVGLTFGDDGEKIEGDGTDLTITGNNINLTATADVNIPSGVGLTFATAEKIESDGTDLSITVGSGGDINIPADIGLTFGNDGEKIEGDGTDLTITGNNINLTATADVVVPANVGVTFGTGEKIEGDNTDLTITSGAKINLTATSDVVIPSGVGLILDGSGDEKIESDGTDISISVGSGGDINIPASIGLTFGDDGEKIEGDGTDLTIASSAKINLTATSDIHVPNNVGIVFGGDSEKIEGDGTDLTISANNLTIDAEADIILDANGANVTFKDNGTSILDIANNSSDVELTVSVADKNFAVKGTDGSSAITALDIDMALAGKATFNGDVVVGGDLTVSGDDITMGTNTAGNLLIADGTNFNSVAIGSLSEISSAADDDVLIAVDTSGGGLKKITRSAIIAGTGSSGDLANVSEDTTPQLGGDLDVNGQDIVSTSNGNITLTPNGTGVVRVDGSNGIDMESGAISIKNSGAESYVRFYCESSNAHYTQLQAAPHSAYSGNVTVVLPASADTLVGRDTTDTLTNKTLTTPVIAEIDNSSDITLDAGGDIILDADGANIIFKDGGTSILDIANNSSDVEFTVSTADKNFAIKGTDGSSAITALDIDMALAGKATFNGDVVVGGGLTVNGTTTTVNSTTVTIDDPIMTLGGDTAPGSDDNKDRGIEFRYHTGSAAKKGFFGFDDSASKFTFIADATNSSEVFSGSAGDVAFGDIDAAGDVSVGDDLSLASDAAVLGFGADTDVTLTHVADTGLLLNSTMQLQFNDASQFINAPSATVLDINATDEIELNATLVDVNANLDVSGTYTGGGLMTTGGNIVIPDAGNIGSASDTDAISISSGGVVTFSQNIIIPDAGNIGSASDTDAISIASNGEVSFTQDITVKTSDGAILKLQTSDTSVGDGDVIGAIEFAAPDESDGTDAVATAASIVAEADATFGADNNKTDLVIKLGKSEAALEKGRFKHEGGLKLTGYDTDANPDPSLELFRDTASPADNDFIGNIYFQGRNDADENITYGAILAVSKDITDGTEDGKLIFRVADAGNQAWQGSANNLITLEPDSISFDASSGTTFGGHDISSVGNITISDGGNIGSASDTDALAISSGGVVNFTQQPTVSSAAVKVAGKETIWIPAAAMYPESTNGCADLTQVELANGPELKCLDFDKSSDEFAQFTIAFPKSWNEGTITFKAYFTATSTDSGDVVWSLAGGSFSDNDDLNTAFGTAVAATAKAHSGTSNDLDVTAESGNVTIAGSPAAEDLCFFRIFRDVSADDLDADARLLGIKLFFTTDAANDA